MTTQGRSGPTDTNPIASMTAQRSRSAVDAIALAASLAPASAWASSFRRLGRVVQDLRQHHPRILIHPESLDIPAHHRFRRHRVIEQ